MLDPVVGAGSVLFTLDELREEFKGFALDDLLARRKHGDMHGAVYERHTLTTIFTTSTPAALEHVLAVERRRSRCGSAGARCPRAAISFAQGGHGKSVT